MLSRGFNRNETQPLEAEENEHFVHYVCHYYLCYALALDAVKLCGLIKLVELVLRVTLGR